MICRMCKGTKFLCNLNEMDGDTTLIEKARICIDSKIYPDDGLPSKICKLCKRKIHRFYKFKINCLRVDSEFRTVKQLEASNAKFGNNIQANTETTEEFERSFCQICPLKNIKGDSSDVDNHIFQTVENTCYNADETVYSSIQCEICGSILDSKTEYKIHLFCHKGSSNAHKPYQCKFCPKHFTRVESREVHMRSHLGIRPFICEICGCSSTKLQDLIRHMKIHSDERNYECHSCGRRFKRSMDLRSHTRTHTGARPYKCSKCENSYTSHSGLRKHMKSHIGKETGEVT